MTSGKEEPNGTATQEQRRYRLSRDLGNLWNAPERNDPFDVVVVGTGYGGSVAAAALAGCRKPSAGDEKVSVCVLERGYEYLPGEFPTRFSDIPSHLRFTRQSAGKVGGAHQGLFDLRVGDDVTVLVANGVGGGSLINAGVLMEPCLEDFEPGTNAHHLIDSLGRNDYFIRARRALGGLVTRGGKEVKNSIDRHPSYSKAPLRKTEALRFLSKDHPFDLPPLSVAMDGCANSAGVKLNPCTLCGDCMTGCNVGAKDSLDANLLEKAARQGVEIYSGATVLSVRRDLAKDSDLWVLRVVHTDPRRQAREIDYLFLRARKVVLAAGTLGSTEILLRSRDDKHVFSSRLGEGFSCNGDNIAAIYRMPVETNGAADEDTVLSERTVGPTITGSITVHDMSRRFRIQEFSVPGPMSRLFKEIVTTASTLNELSKGDPDAHGEETKDAIDPLAVNDKYFERTLLVGLIGHDDAAGTLHLANPMRPTDRPPQQGTLNIRWPEARSGKRLHGAFKQLQGVVAATASKETSVIANPMWHLLPPDLAGLITQPEGPVLTVHPLGGCPMGRSHDEGVVDDLGRVFNPRAGHTFGDLLVLDGSIIPGSLGANPALTIAATAMRAMDAACDRWGFVKPTSTEPEPVERRMRPAETATGPRNPATPTTVEILERLRGVVSLRIGSEAAHDYIVELTLGYEPRAVRTIMATLHRSVQVDGKGDQSRLRIYDKRDWDKHLLRLENDEVRERFVLFDARLEGKLEFLHREASSALQRRWNAVWAWLLNRGLRDTWQELSNRSQPRTRSFCNYVESLWKLASRAGEVRRFDYDLTVGKVLLDRAHPGMPRLGEAICLGSVIKGCKRLTYNRRANPWKQLSELTLDEMPGMQQSPVPKLALDLRFFVSQGFPLLRVTGQQDQALALADLVSLALLMARLLVSIHLWTFRKPDTPSLAEPVRLPGPIPGQHPEITELIVDRMPNSDVPVKIRLTRYKPALQDGRHADDARSLPPLVMIHGYSVSGNTFTHPSLAPSAATYFCDRGRDVWVVDLRTSTGMPTASYPWAIEQPALIDIPAALLYVRNVTRQRVDVLAHCVGCAMLGMALLTDATEIRRSIVQLGTETWLTSGHFGTLAAFNGEPGKMHPCVNRVVLSQKGPVLRYTDDNVFRAFIMQSARRLLLTDAYQFRPPHNPTVSDQLLDRFLSSLPYPDADYDVENPLWPCSKTPWTTTRHRMDALYGRDFDAANLSEATLEAIDDLFGPISLDTVAQTIHFARFNAITNQRGRGEFVTRKRLRERWGHIPTLAIHGADNGLADVATQDLLEAQLKGAGVPFLALPSKAEPYRHLGHQDVLIGTESARVFKDIDDFLCNAPPLNDPPPLPELVIAIPWIGPRIDFPDTPRASPCLRCMSYPDQGEARAYVFPACLTRSHESLRPIYKVQRKRQYIRRSSIGDSNDWLTIEPRLDMNGVQCGKCDVLGYLCLLVYDRDQTTAVDEPAWGHPWRVNTDDRKPADKRAPGAQGVTVPRLVSSNWADHHVVFEARFLAEPQRQEQLPDIDSDGASANIDPQFARKLLARVTKFVSLQSTDALAMCFVRLEDLTDAARLNAADEPLDGFGVALASCQYPSGLLDGPTAESSLKALATALDQSRAKLVVFAGDQIYADATAGLIDPVRRDELFDEPSTRALRNKALRAVLRRAPARMLMDDHELSDNWEPLPSPCRERRPGDATRNDDTARFGQGAWNKYQRMRGSRKTPAAHFPVDERFTFAGYPFFVADTRLGRSARGSLVPPKQRQILVAEQWKELEVWLLAHEDSVKFIATPSLLLPRRWSTAVDPFGFERSDSWDGFPRSLERLLRFIAENEIRNTVFLSGDEHHALVAEAWVDTRAAAAHKPVKVVSIHSSALYAPFPFANGCPMDLEQDTTVELGAVNVAIRTTFAPPGDGFTLITVKDPSGEPALVVEFVKNDGASVDMHTVSLA